jgi:hypothetical protein
MRPVVQTTFGYPLGNCYAACVASLLEIPLESCPVIPAGADWNGIWDAWFAARGIARVCFSLGDGSWVPKGYAILSGISPRVMFDENNERVHHCCVGLNGELVHDPHPDQSFLEGVTMADILYPLDPSTGFHLATPITPSETL